MDGWITLREAWEKFGVHRETLRLWCAAGQIESVVSGPPGRSIRMISPAGQEKIQEMWEDRRSKPKPARPTTQEQIEAHLKTIASLQQEIEKMGQHEDHLVSLWGKQERTIQVLTKSIAELVNKKNKPAQPSEESKDSQLALESALDVAMDLAEYYHDCSDYYARITSDLEAQRKSAEEKLTEAADSAEKLEGDVRRTSQLNGRLKSEVSSLHDEIAKLKSSLEDARAEVNDTNNALDSVFYDLQNKPLILMAIERVCKFAQNMFKSKH